MPLTTAQQRVRAALCNDHDVVSVLDLGTRAAILGRNTAGAVERALVVDAIGNELDTDAALEALTAARALAQQQESQATEYLRGMLVNLHAQGRTPNLRKLGRDTGIARSTIYSWLHPAS